MINRRHLLWWKFLGEIIIVYLVGGSVSYYGFVIGLMINTSSVQEGDDLVYKRRGMIQQFGLNYIVQNIGESMVHMSQYIYELQCTQLALAKFKMSKVSFQFQMCRSDSQIF